MSSVDNDRAIRERVDAFVDDLSELIRISALEAVQEALAGAATPSGRSQPARAARKTARRATPGKRIRRSSAEVEALQGKILAHVQSHPGQRLGEIAKALNLATKDARRPAFQLVESKALKTTGQRGGTRYFARGASTSAASSSAPRKATKKAKKKRSTKKAG